MKVCEEQTNYVWTRLAEAYEEIKTGTIPVEKTTQKMSEHMKTALRKIIEHYDQNPVKLVPYDADPLTYKECATPAVPPPMPPPDCQPGARKAWVNSQ